MLTDGRASINRNVQRAGRQWPNPNLDIKHTHRRAGDLRSARPNLFAQAWRRLWLFLVLVQKNDLHSAFFFAGDVVEQARSLGAWRIGGSACGRQGRTERAFHQFGAMNLHGWERPEFTREFVGFQSESLFGGFAFDQLSGQAGNSDCCFAAKR